MAVCKMADGGMASSRFAGALFPRMMRPAPGVLCGACNGELLAAALFSAKMLVKFTRPNRDVSNRWRHEAASLRRSSLRSGEFRINNSNILSILLTARALVL